MRTVPASFTVTHLRFYDDPDFPGYFIYTWTVNDGIICISVVSDEYAARVKGVS